MAAPGRPFAAEAGPSAVPEIPEHVTDEANDIDNI